MAKDNPEKPGETAGPVEGAPKKDAPAGAKKSKGKGERPAEAAAPAEGAAPAAAEAKPKKEPKAEKKAAAAEGQARGPRGKKQRGRPSRRRSRRHRANVEKIDENKQYPIDEGIKLLKETTRGTKFVQTINLVMNLGIDPKVAEQMIRGAVSLPKGIGKAKRVIAFCDGEDAEKAKAAGAVEIGIEDLVKKITDGWLDFDVAIAHPRSMGKVGKLGRVLGPQGKMPTPKNGTVTADVATAVREFAAGKVEFRNDAGGNVHAVVGKADFSEADLKENILAFVDHIRKMKPASSKGTYMKKTCIYGTMSPGIELQLA
jgi:large subunit ribosomal protein L1